MKPEVIVGIVAAMVALVVGICAPLITYACNRKLEILKHQLSKLESGDVTELTEKKKIAPKKTDEPESYTPPIENLIDRVLQNNWLTLGLFAATMVFFILNVKSVIAGHDILTGSKVEGLAGMYIRAGMSSIFALLSAKIAGHAVYMMFWEAKAKRNIQAQKKNPSSK